MCTLSRKIVLFIVFLLVPVIIILTWVEMTHSTNDTRYIRNLELMVVTKCKTRDIKPFPRIIHRAFGFWDSSLPEGWKVSLNSCAEEENEFKVMFWNKTSSIKFLQCEYPWFVKEYLAYLYPVQQADAVRYFILHHYGGIYLDMDIKCTNHSSLSLFYNQFISQEPGLDAVLLQTDPTGITNYFVLTKQCSKFMAHSISRLSNANSWYLIPYLTVVASTGPMFLSFRYTEFTKMELHNKDRIKLIKQHQFWTNYFMNTGKHGTWHDWDANIVLLVYRMFTLTNLFILLLLIFVTLWVVFKTGYCRSNKGNNTDKQRDNIDSIPHLPKTSGETM